MRERTLGKRMRKPPRRQLDTKARQQVSLQFVHSLAALDGERAEQNEESTGHYA